MNEEFINYLYSNNIDIIISKLTFKNKKYTKLVQYWYLEALKERFENMKLSGDSEILKNRFDSIEKKWINRSTDEQMLSYLIPDDNLDQLRTYSDIAFELARDRLVIDASFFPDDDHIELIEKMKMYKSLVFDFNKSIAERLYSDGMLDYQFATAESIKTSKMSFRLHDEYNFIKMQSVGKHK